MQQECCVHEARPRQMPKPFRRQVEGLSRGVEAEVEAGSSLIGLSVDHVSDDNNTN